jgi:ferredoxin-NADP reductase
VSLGGVEGDFVLPTPLPRKLLFISAGSGITPIMSMLRELAGRHELTDAVLLHSAPNPKDVIFGGELRYLDKSFRGFRLHEQHTVTMGRMTPPQLDALCPDWREREAFASGPGDMLDALTDHCRREERLERLHLERFQPKLDAEPGEGGTIKFLVSDVEVEADGTRPILLEGEEAGLELRFGCREGICHTCVGKLRKGRLRDLRSGRVCGQEGETVRICVNAPEGDVEIEL